MKLMRFSLALVMGFASASTLAQVNSWTGSTSGDWDQPSSWSLGVLPNSSQSVQITNSGFKAVAINPSTPVNFPASMTVASLTIRGGTDSENVLLLNFATFNFNLQLQTLSADLTVRTC